MSLQLLSARLDAAQRMGQAQKVAEGGAASVSVETCCGGQDSKEALSEEQQLALCRIEAAELVGNVDSGEGEESLVQLLKVRNKADCAAPVAWCFCEGTGESHGCRCVALPYAECHWLISHPMQKQVLLRLDPGGSLALSLSRKTRLLLSPSGVQEVAKALVEVCQGVGLGHLYQKLLPTHPASMHINTP